MKSLQKQFNKLVFKILVLLLFAFTANSSSLFAQSTNDTLYIQALYDSTKIYYTNGNDQKAIEDLHKVLTIKNRCTIDIEPKYFKVYNRLGLVYKKQGGLKKAINFYKEALNNTNNDFYQSAINDNIANIYTLIGEYSKAISFYKNNLSIIKNSKNANKFITIANNFHNQGYAYNQLGEYNLAKENYLRCIQISNENNLEISGDTYFNCGISYQKLDSLKKADFYFKKAIEYYAFNVGEMHYMTGTAYMFYAVFYNQKNEFIRSEFLFKKAYNILINTIGAKHPYTSLCLKNTGDLYLKKQDYNTALHYYQQSLIAKIQDFNDSSIYSNPASKLFPDLDLLDVLNAKAKALEKLAGQGDKEQNLMAALKTLELNVRYIEQLRTGYLYESSKLQLASKEHDTYVSIVRIAYSLYEITGAKQYAETAFKHAELSKYAILRELENEETAKHLSGIPDSLQEKEYKLKEQISYAGIQLENENKLQKPNSENIEEYNKKLFGLSNELDALKQKLESDYPAYYKQKYKPRVVNSADIQAVIENKDAIIEYVLGDSSLFTFMITKDSFLFQRQFVNSNFNKSLDFYTEFQHSLYNLSYDSFRIAAYELYKYLLLPIEKNIKGKNLILIPDNKLSLISFDAFVDEPYINVESVDYRKEPYIIKKYPIGYAFSATLYFNSKHQYKKVNRKILVFAPDYIDSKDSLPELPLPVKNLRNIKLYFNMKVFESKNASENNFKKNYQRYGILHFYTHGYEDSINPSLSKMFFSQYNDTIDDGYLYAYEVNNLRINADLVVLASCFSGSGIINKGEGVMSMGRSFLNAGSSSLIMSLWATAHTPALQELKSFYRHLAAGKRKDEALRLAKLEYLENCEPINAHPKYWTSLVIVGNQDALVSKVYLIKRILMVFLVISFLGIIIFIIRRKIKTNSN